jgi:hypothetical protein
MRSTGNDIRTAYCKCRSNVRASVSQDRRHGIAFERLKLRILNLGIKPGANDKLTGVVGAKATPDPPLHPEGLYYTDARLVHTITNVHNDEIRTCHHEHFDRRHEMGSGSMTDIKKNEAKLKYVDRLINHRGQQLRGLTIAKTDNKLPEPIRLKIEELKPLLLCSRPNQLTFSRCAYARGRARGALS